MIIVEPPETPPAFVQQVERPMVACGLNRDRVRVVLSEEHQRIEIHVPEPSGADADTVSCLVRQRGVGRYIFEDDNLQTIYSSMLKIFMDQSFESATQILRNEGKLEGLPGRTDFENDTDFAQALETHCGFSPGTVLRVQDGSTLYYPLDASKPLSAEELKASRCMSAAFALIALEKEGASWGDLAAEFDPMSNRKGQ